MAELFQQVPDAKTPVLQDDSTTLVYIAGALDRYLIIANTEKLAEISATLNSQFIMMPYGTYWKFQQAFQYFLNNIAEYVPQMLNLQAIDGISFTKGCYLGQETVARMQYLGKNKRALFALTGNNMVANVGDIIEKKLGDNWRKAGDVLAVYQASNMQSYIQGVLANDIDDATELRIKTQDSNLTRLPLPYKLSTETE